MFNLCSLYLILVADALLFMRFILDIMLYGNYRGVLLIINRLIQTSGLFKLLLWPCKQCKLKRLSLFIQVNFLSHLSSKLPRISYRESK